MGIRRALLSIVAIEPVLSIIRWQQLAGKLPCLMYHEVLPDNIDAGLWTAVRESDFHKQLQHLSRRYTPIGIEEALHEYRLHGRWPNGAVVITFDDGYRGNLNTALPIAESYNVPITVFVATRWIEEGVRHWFDRLMVYLLLSNRRVISSERITDKEFVIEGRKNTEVWWNSVSSLLEYIKQYSEEDRNLIVSQIVQGAEEEYESAILAPLSVENLKTLANSELVSIGAHSHGHEILTKIQLTAAQQSVARSKELLEEWMGITVKHFAYPNGNFNNRVIDILKEMSFESAVINTGGAWKNGDDLYALPRIAIGRFDSLGLFRLGIAGMAR